MIPGLSYDESKKYHIAANKGYLTSYSNAWRHTFVGAYVWKYPNRTQVLDIMQTLLERFPEWDDLTNEFLLDVKNEMSRRGLAANSQRTMMAELKAVINLYKDSRVIPIKDGYQKILSAKAEPSQAIFLNEDELETFGIYSPQNDLQRWVQRCFMVEALTGARHEDSVNLSAANCDSSTGMLKYVASKTKTEVTVPVHRLLMPFLSDTKKYECHLASFNSCLRIICRNLGFNEPTTLFAHGIMATQPKYMFVSSHTGRRSFATNLYLRGVPLETIATLMGHMSAGRPDIQMTLRYICAQRAITDDKVLNFFKMKK